MFEALSDKLSGVFDRLRRRGALNETDVMEALREVRLALLDADVALPVVRDFIAKVRDRAVGQEVLDSVSPGQQVVKIVNDVMIEALGGEGAVGLNLNATTGGIDLSTSTPGTYAVTYAFTDGTCNNTTTTSVTVNAIA